MTIIEKEILFYEPDLNGVFYEQHLNAANYLIRETEVFVESDDDLLAEHMEIAISNDSSEQYDFNFIFAKHENQLIGFSCYGYIPTTEKRFELYWLVVSPRFHGKGIGKGLLENTIEKLKDNNIPLLFAETSSKPGFLAARALYQRMGFTECGRLPDYFRDGDDKIIYRKIL